VVWRKYLPVRSNGGDVTPKEVEEFFEAAPPHASEELETETYRVVDWLLARASALSKCPRHRVEREDETGAEEIAQPDSDQAPSPSTQPFKPNDIVAFALTPAGDLRESYRLGDLAEGQGGKKLTDRLNRDLVGATLVVDAGIGGLIAGLLNDDAKDPPPTADSSSDWLPPLGDGSPAVQFQVHAPAKPKSVGTIGRETYAFPTRRSEEGEDEEVLLVETWTTEESRAASVNPQTLAKHHSQTERQALALALAGGVPRDHGNALAIAARLHDEGKRTTRWQRAFNAPHDGDAYAKTKGPINQALLDGYRHEFGSLLCIENDAAFKVLPPDLQDLVLHLVAAHHGLARPIIATAGCEDAPPSALEGRARDVALRFARVQKCWGPWGLAWWEALLRAADQHASRDNDEHVNAGNGDDA
jgi:CRISPR-associated endonuclease/helicase Cas3